MCHLNKSRLLFIPFVFLFLIGCAGSNRVALKKATIPNKTEVRLLIPYDEPIIQSKPKYLSNGANGAVGDMLDANAIAIYQSRIETETSALYEEIVDVDLTTLFFKAIQSEFRDLEELSKAKINITNGSISTSELSNYKSSLEDNSSSLLMRVRHQFSNDGKSLIGVAGLYWVASNQELPIYQNMLFYVSKPLPIDTQKEAYEYWFRNHGEKLQAEYLESARVFAELLSTDFESASNEELKAKSSDSTKKSVVPIPIILGVPLIKSSMMPPGVVPDGVILEEDANKAVIRGNYNNSMYWIGK